MPFFDYLIGGCLRTDYASATVDILSAIGSAREVTDSAMLERVWANPLAMEVLKRKGIQLRGCPGFFFRAGVFFRGVGRGFLCLAMSPLSIIAGIWAHFQLRGVLRDLADINNPKANAGDKTVFDLMREANSPQGQIAQRSGKPVRIIKGSTNDLSACYYDALGHVVSIPSCIGKTIAMNNGTPCTTESGKQYGAPTALAIGFHEAGHAEQCYFLRIIHFSSLAALALLIFALSIVAISGVPEIVVTGLVILAMVAIVPLVFMPVIQFFYERDASVRAIANLLAYGYITTQAAAVEATYVLQIAACTYLMNTVRKVSEMGWNLLEICLNSKKTRQESGLKP
jgi:hypothetical protein